MSDYFDTDGTRVTDEELARRYDDMLDECYGDVSVAGYEYATSRALKELDPIAYRCGLADWSDAEAQDGALWSERWTAGSNVPGYLPDNTPDVFGDWQDAWSVVKADLEHDAENSDDPAERDRVLSLLATDEPQPGKDVSILAFGQVYWITNEGE